MMMCALQRLRLLLIVSAVVLAMQMFVCFGVQGKQLFAEETTRAPDWSRDIAPVLYKNCTSCHHPDGAGPFSLVTYEDAKRWAPQILTVTQSRYMPPWLPEPGYGDFADSRRLSDHDVALIKRWILGGASRGSVSQAPLQPHYSSTWTLGKPDLILTVEEPFTLPASGQDVFRNFILPNPLQQTRYVRAMQIMPGAPGIVHHANVLVDRTGEYRRQHPGDWKQGVPGMELVVDAGKTFDPDGHFLFWKPDTPALVEPEGMSSRLDPGSDLILNMHLKPSGKPEAIRAQIGLYFTDAPPKKLPMLLQLDRDDALDIPAGDSSFTLDDALKLPVDVRLLGIYPHAHYLGKEMKAWATLPGGRNLSLIWIRDWDIDRQSVYRYKDPLLLPAGTTLHMHYVYDNSAENPHNPHSPPIEVHAGNGSEDEMAHLWLQVLPLQAANRNTPDPRLLLEEAWMRERLIRTPKDYVSLYNLGAALTGEGNNAEAVEVFSTILRDRPGDGRAWNALGAAKANSGEWRQARETYAGALQNDPGNCDAHFNLAELNLTHDENAEAETEFRTFLANCGEDADAYAGLAMALLKEQKFVEAQAQFSHALSFSPDKSKALELRRHLAFVYVQAGDLDEGLVQLRQAVNLAPDDAAGHALLAQVLSQANQLTEAITEQKTALRLHSKDADGWNNLGVFEARAGDINAARRDFEQVQRIDPGNQQARENLSRIVH